MSKEQMDAYLNKGNSTADYVNMVNQRSPLDDVGDAYSNFANKPTYSGKQRMTSAIMGGIGGGLKSAASSERKSKLAELEKANREVALLDASVKKNIGSAVNKQSQYLSVATNNIPTIDALTNAVIAEDQPAISDIMGTLVASVQSEAPDLLKGMGKYQKTIDGVSYFKTEDGKHVGFPMKQSLSNFISALPPEKQEQYMPLLSDVAQQKFKKRDMFDYAAIDEKRAHAAAQYGSANQSNAHADYYNAQTDSMSAASQNPSKYDDKTRQYIAKSNIDWLNKEAPEQIRNSEKAGNAYAALGKIISDESNIGGRAGQGFISQWQRYFNKSGTESSKNQALAEMYKSPLMSEFKQIYGHIQSESDLKNFLLGLPSIDKDPAASIMIASERSKELLNDAKRIRKQRDIVEKKFQYGEPYGSEAVLSSVDEELSRENSAATNKQKGLQSEVDGGSIRSIMNAPSGFKINIPKQNFELLE